MQKKLTILTALAFSTLCLFFSSCKKDPVQPTTPGSHEPAVCPVGAPVGDPESFIIGPEGGTFTSADHTLRIDIPAGAVTSSTALSIQPVTNTCPGGLGMSMGLTPHGTQFAKPATIEFSYADKEEEVNIPEALGIAYQDNKGIWRLVKDAVVDKNTKTVHIQTTHFSNWSLLQWLKLEPVTATISPDETINLQVRSFVDLENGDLLAPLVTKDAFEAGIASGFLLPASYIKKWELGGVGKLSSNGSEATYTAPPSVTQPTTVAVSAQLTSTRHQLLVISNITIIPNGIAIKINGGEWKYFPGLASASDHNGFGISSGAPQNGLTVTLTWQGGIGNHTWNSEVMEGPATALGINDLNTSSTYNSYYLTDPDEEVKQSGGFLKIDELGQKGEYVSGSFSASPSGHISYVTGKQLNTASIKGYFHVKRVY